MVAGFLKLVLKLDHIDEAIHFWNLALAQGREKEPAIREKLQGSLLLVDRKTGHAYSVGLWATAEDSQAFQNSALYTQLIAGLGVFCVKPPIREQFDIAGGSLDNVILSRLAA